MSKINAFFGLTFWLQSVFIFGQSNSEIMNLDWSHQQFEKFSFAIFAPGDVSEKELSIETEVGSVDQFVKYWKDDNSETLNYLYSLTIYDYPVGSFHPDSNQLIQMFFDETVVASQKAVGGELLYQDDYLTRGNPTHLWKMSFQDENAFVKSKMVLVGDRCYCLQVFMLKEHQKNKNADQFLESFRLI